LEAAETSEVTFRVFQNMFQLTIIEFVIVNGSHMLPGRTMFAINDARAPDPPWATTLASSALSSFKFHSERDQPPQHTFSCRYRARVPRLFLLYTSPHQTGVLMPSEATILFCFVSQISCVSYSQMQTSFKHYFSTTPHINHTSLRHTSVRTHQTTLSRYNPLHPGPDPDAFETQVFGPAMFSHLRRSPPWA
jgi:hypothetical protein